MSLPVGRGFQASIFANKKGITPDHRRSCKYHLTPTVPNLTLLVSQSFLPNYQPTHSLVKVTMQLFTFVQSAVFAATVTAQGCHFWVQEKSTGNNVLQKCLQKNEAMTAFINGQSIYIQANSDCRVTVSNTGYNTAPVGFNAYYDGPC
ncbi:hypothetical protein CDEST_09483 [Colletotrichum destructivum]|uniref:Uncharacterized protein n=1 Tax=Colletotrichum destructivum TaxID=34406 RepID=A0AAX4IMD4_9PEZI|nr:hypothetical protein CDEST_09483 [Colletotrichum destructivum]